VRGGEGREEISRREISGRRKAKKKKKKKKGDRVVIVVVVGGSLVFGRPASGK